MIVVDDSDIQRIVLVTEETTMTTTSQPYTHQMPILLVVNKRYEENQRVTSW